MRIKAPGTRRHREEGDIDVILIGDRTQHVLRRLQISDVGGIQPKIALGLQTSGAGVSRSEP